MGIEFFSVSLIMILAVVTPGPDFAIVTQNTLAYSRQKGFFTGLGIAISNLFHTSYCLLGLTVVMTKSLLVFSVIKFAGAAYLIYLGIKALRAKRITPEISAGDAKTQLSNCRAFIQGFLCNALNPKAALLFLSIFTVFVTPETPLWLQLLLGIELTLINLIWYAGVSSFLTLGSVKKALLKVQYALTKIMGACLVLFGVKLATLQR